MITHQCEACGKTEDITGNSDDYEGRGRLNLRGRLCKEHIKVYQELHGAIESKHLSAQRSSLEHLRENMVTEVRKKCSIIGCKKGTLDLHELIREWLCEIDSPSIHNKDTQIMHNFMLEVANRLEG